MSNGNIEKPKGLFTGVLDGLRTTDEVESEVKVFRANPDGTPGELIRTEQATHFIPKPYNNHAKVKP